jgi:hypothetical protein
MGLPDDWKSKTTLDSFTECLNRLSHSQRMLTFVEEVIEAHTRSTICESALDIPAVLRTGL